ncbi:DUF4177 domain-containing protein [Litorivita pollutaquae]|uniref:DUF4177 domain-containing protein n=1 Tax=Litorivita pollutaquae TaxID=2200892 RepID=A0A2V4MPD1_9RHOB|nr:DUF4177 domain-containing protein [Litorivita pollutaquae]PYC48575.1 DUF4177 domain-containing protein [Litorivita pollutaquae]
MIQYDYRVIPAPTKGRKAKGIKTAEARFAHTIETVMNEMAAQGWEFQRAETLPSEERSGLTSTTVNYRNLLVFRRPKNGATESFAPRLLDAPAPQEAAEVQPALPDAPPASETAPISTSEHAAQSPAAVETKPADPPVPAPTAQDGAPADNGADNGVEGTVPPDPSLARAVRRRAALIGRAVDTKESQD